MKTYQTTMDGEAPGAQSAERLAGSLADALQSIAKMPPVAPGADITLGDAINAYHGAVRIARDAVRFYNARQRVTVPDSDDDAILNAMAEELSPNAVALIAIRLRRHADGPARRIRGVRGARR